MKAPWLFALTLCFPVVHAGTARADSGEGVFRRTCIACHTVDGTNRVGPSLAGILGRKAGTAPGFAYSDAIRNSGITWDEERLDAYTADPRATLPGSKMFYPGLKNVEDRKALIAYLKGKR